MSTEHESGADAHHEGGSELSAAGFPDNVPAFEVREGRYLIRFARTPEEVQTALKLRYEVFNLEMHEGLEASHVTGHDEDDFDAGCHHLLVIHEGDPAQPVVGTYRLQTREMAARHAGFYSDGEYVLADMGDEILNDSVEIGRACVAKEHRKQRVLFRSCRGNRRRSTRIPPRDGRRRRTRARCSCCRLSLQRRWMSSGSALSTKSSCCLSRVPVISTGSATRSKTSLFTIRPAGPTSIR